MEENQLAYFFDACRRGDGDDVKKICELLPHLINTPDSKGYSALIIAAYNNQPEIVNLLLENGANVNAADAAGNTALMGACFKGFPEIAEILVQSGADVNQRNLQGAPALTFAATFGQLAIAELLLKNGAVTNLPDSRGKTALDHAHLQENTSMISLLQSYPS